MKNNKYKHTKTTVSLINYHFVFCPRYRRKIFNIDVILYVDYSGLDTDYKVINGLEPLTYWFFS